MGRKKKKMKCDIKTTKNPVNGKLMHISFELSVVKVFFFNK